MLKNIPLRWMVLLFVFWTLAACQFEKGKSGSDEKASSDQGSLSLTLSQRSTRLLQPDVSLDVNTYRIQGVGPAGANFDLVADNSGSVTIDFLRFGSWNVMVEAINAQGYVFARGSREVVINVGETTDAIILVSMLEDVGSFELGISWPQIEVQSPILTGFLRADGQADIPLNFVAGTAQPDMESRIAVHTNSIPAGYYTLIVTVHDEGAGGQNHLAMGLAETVRILEGQTTQGSFELSGTPGVGSLLLSILLDADEPISILFDNPQSLPTSFVYDTDTQFTASVSVDEGDEDFGAITFVWYLNGELLAIADSYTFDSTASPQLSTVNGRYLPGHYRVDVIGFNTDGSRAGSAQYEFDVTGNPVGIALPSVFGSVTGQVGTFVADGDDQLFVPMLGAQILVGGRTVMADANGNYTVNFVADGAQTVQVVVDGYFSAFKPVTVVDQQTTQVDRILLRATETFSVDATAGGSVSTFNGGATVNFGAGVIVDANNNPYTGTVTVKATAVDPMSNDFFEAFPGDFTGLTEGGDVVDIISFGAIAVELEDANGNELNIADGQTVEIRIEVADPANAPPTLALWYLDETTGQWTEEGVATLVGNEYVGNVSHFSWWNFDYVASLNGYYGSGIISGSVVDANNQPVAWANVTLNSVAGLAWAQNTTTDAAGNFSVQAYLAQNISDAYYAAYANKDGLQSQPVAVRISTSSSYNVSGVVIRLQAPEISMTATGRVGSVTQVLLNNGPQLRFGPNSTFATVTLSNTAVDGLDISAITLTNNSSGAFTLINANPNVARTSGNGTRGDLNAGDSLSFVVQYLSPGNGSTSNANLVITSNDADAPTMTIALEAGTSLSAPVTETVSLGHMSTHIGYMLRDAGNNVYAVNTDTETAALVFEANPDAYRVYFAVDTANLPAGITAVNSVDFQLTSAGHNGVNLFQGSQGALLDAASFAPATGTALSVVPIAAGITPVVLNQDARDLFLSVIQNPTQTAVPLMIMATDAIPGTVDLTSLSVIINYTR